MIAHCATSHKTTPAPFIKAGLLDYAHVVRVLTPFHALIYNTAI